MIPQMRFDEENEVLFLKFTEVWSEEDIPKMFSRMRGFFEGRKQNNIIGDVSQAAPQSYSKEFRRMVADEAATLNLDKVAVCGANPVLRMMAKVLLAVIGKKWAAETKFCRDEAEALAWLKGTK